MSQLTITLLYITIILYFIFYISFEFFHLIKKTIIMIIIVLQINSVRVLILFYFRAQPKKPKLILFFDHLGIFSYVVNTVAVSPSTVGFNRCSAYVYVMT